MPPVVGMRFGRYELLDKLGAGGMGEPFAAIPDRLGRFAQEARAALRVRGGGAARGGASEEGQ